MTFASTCRPIRCRDHGFVATWSWQSTGSTTGSTKGRYCSKSIRFDSARATARFTLRPFVWNRSIPRICSPSGTRTYRLDPRFGFGASDAPVTDWAAWTDGGGLRIDSLSIPQAEVESYKNRQVPRPQRVKQLFYRSLQRLPFAVDVRRITLGNVRARYDELSENGTEPGIVQFDSLSGEFYGLTNRGGADDFFRLEARGKLYGAGLLKASFRFPSDSLNRRFEIDGLPRADEPAVVESRRDAACRYSDRFRTARADRIPRDGNDARSEVQMTMLYDGLDVEMVKRQPDGRLKDRRLMTFVVDKMLIRPSNPDGRGTRTADGSTERDPYRSQFNYWWKSLLPVLRIPFWARIRTGSGPSEKSPGRLCNTWFHRMDKGTVPRIFTISGQTTDIHIHTATCPANRPLFPLPVFMRPSLLVTG